MQSNITRVVCYSLIVRQPAAGAKVAEMDTVHEDNDTWVRPYGAPRKYTKQWTARGTFVI